ncbi:DUF523 domain-containing protein [Clostridium chauvoei]|uniref:Uncharacterized protein n=2 Tax=Clostridium chauvoei TaxID=46867 RepID=A0A1U6JFL5_9CLOT|nr:DUF523 domain-containing protein [Clostridium chauvoei]ATD55265.1 hypothetical protein BTM20_08435 [Clostridium chauvoei]ATD57063.1 hypothetical protein BTM21_04605 [Clostridium chauvoei]MBX7279615.1 DUF523 domain-containing protein [Clostridium chauvoei]MBX7281984.1 DUF523 domain-containing protein [Clostridium chauvoei]MBX7284427.1 DUF523 domain-containing protein [Clostridium chauvoei]
MYIISGCLCGINCKYNGKNNLNSECMKLFKEGKAILVCPEQLGGLSTPRRPAEMMDNPRGIIEGKGILLNNNNVDVTEFFKKGALEVLNIAKMINPKMIILKDGSPSCGVNYVYDGSFSGKKILGQGLTTFILKENGFKVISELDLGGEKSGILESIQEKNK